MGGKNNFLGAVDIGSTKICVIIAGIGENGRPVILGMGESKSMGIERGMVINAEQASDSIREAVMEAEEKAGMDMPPAFVGISGEHVKSMNNRGVIVLPPSRTEITPADKKKVMETAQAISMPPNQEILHVLSQEFIVDDRRGITEPVGLSGSRLEVEVHIVTIATSSANDLKNCLRNAGVSVRKLVLEPLASSYAVLQEDEKRLGVVLVDIGGGTTDVAVFQGGFIRHSAVVPLGGTHVTNDLAAGLTTPIYEAERIKVTHGNTYTAEGGSREMVEIPGFGRDDIRTLSVDTLGAIIQPRVKEIFDFVLLELNRTESTRYVAAGIVVTGGGAMLGGLQQYLEELFGVRVRIGYPENYSYNDEEINETKYATCIGLLEYGFERLDSYWNRHHVTTGFFGGLLGHIKNTIRDMFVFGEGG